jgi:predicted PurR-regulated permease PerM
VNARLVAGHINAWELLIAMLVMDSLFGIRGVVVGPIVYAYMKRELKIRGLV